jgi:glycosyltransferase involved in cell wall biosynthesis
MRVLVAHNRYRTALPSGENEVVDTEIAALRDLGVDVIPYLRSSDEIAQMGTVQRLWVPFQPMHAREAVSDVTRILASSRPDVLHLHNPFPLLSWSVAGAARKQGVPVVVTLHNHRHSCLRGTYSRDGRPCVLCRGKATPWPGVQHACYRDSRLQSIPMAAALRLHRRDQRAVDRYVALTQAGANSIIEAGLAVEGQVVVRPNTVADPGPASVPGTGLLFIGRLSAEKGVPLLLNAWTRGGAPFGTLTLVGDGPERSLAESHARRPGSGVEVAGQLHREGVSAAIRACAAVVLPSVSTEGMPLVLLEALSHGRPVIVTEGTGADEIVTDEIGWRCPPTEEALARCLAAAAAGDLASRGRMARADYEHRFSPPVVMTAQIEIYRDVIAQHPGKPS